MSDISTTKGTSTGTSTGTSGPTTNLAGRELGDYRLLSRLGTGGMAEVYLAEQVSLRRRIALKVLRHSLAADERFVRRFHQEAQAAAALVHANIVQIYEVGQWQIEDGNTLHFIAQEYVAGETLRHLLIRLGPLPVALALQILQQVAAALQRASERSIVHRDIKPENILLSVEGDVKVTDFGLARILDGTQNLELTQPGTIWGTPLYMSPEQIQARPLDPRSDLYSLGATAYHMLVGQPPFTGESIVAVAVQHLSHPPTSLNELRPDLPRELAEAVERLLQKSPGDRFPSAGELREWLDRITEVDPLEWPVHDAVMEHADPQAATEQLQRLLHNPPKANKRWSARLGWGTAMCVAFLGGGLLAWQQRPSNPLQVAQQALPPIPREETAQQQFASAMSLGTERALLAVSRYFPPEQQPDHKIYERKAQLQLAYLYEETDRADEALALYQQLASSNADRNIQIIAMIGVANLSLATNAPAQANQILYQLAETVRQTRPSSPREMQEWLQRLNPALRSDFQRLLEETR